MDNLIVIEVDGEFCIVREPSMIRVSVWTEDQEWAESVCKHLNETFKNKE